MEGKGKGGRGCCVSVAGGGSGTEDRGSCLARSNTWLYVTGRKRSSLARFADEDTARYASVHTCMANAFLLSARSAQGTQTLPLARFNILQRGVAQFRPSLHPKVSFCEPPSGRKPDRGIQRFD
jgi:hypothetical protein